MCQQLAAEAKLGAWKSWLSLVNRARLTLSDKVFLIFRRALPWRVVRRIAFTPFSGPFLYYYTIFSHQNKPALCSFIFIITVITHFYETTIIWIIFLLIISLYITVNCTQRLSYFFLFCTLYFSFNYRIPRSQNIHLLHTQK